MLGMYLGRGSAAAPLSAAMAVHTCHAFRPRIALSLRDWRRALAAAGYRNVGGFHTKWASHNLSYSPHRLTNQHTTP